jgi:hypothetical protein
MILAVVSCGNGSSTDKQQLTALQADYERLSADYEELNSYLGEIASGLDSIAVQEGQLFATNSTPGESPALSREQIKKNLEAYKQTLASQRERIGSLEKKLKGSKGSNTKLLGIVESLNAQLAAKDAELDKLRKQVASNNVSIDYLMSSVNSLLFKTNEQEQTINEQKDALDAKDNKLNEAFVKMGPKAELKKLGLLSGGNLLKKSKVDYDNMDPNLFKRIDKRKTKTIEIPYKKAKILTPVPSDSYSMEERDDRNYLVITNAEKFWSVSNYLIIQAE